MIVNPFKDGVLESLKQYNQEIVDVCDKHIINPYGLGNTNGHSCWWFDPRNQNKLHLTASWRKYGEIVYPEPDPKVYDPKYCLLMYVYNYFSVWIVNKLFEDKNILIEDLGCGLSQFSFYLQKLGFKNFSLLENFQYISKPLFHDFQNRTKLNYVLNEPNTKPVVTNLCGHHPYPKEITPSTELFCIYEKTELIEMFDKLDGYTYLCKDNDDLTHAYARNDKYEEFKAKLEPYKVD